MRMFVEAGGVRAQLLVLLAQRGRVAHETTALSIDLIETLRRGKKRGTHLAQHLALRLELLARIGGGALGGIAARLQLIDSGQQRTQLVRLLTTLFGKHLQLQTKRFIVARGTRQLLRE